MRATFTVQFLTFGLQLLLTKEFPPQVYLPRGRAGAASSFYLMLLGCGNHSRHSGFVVLGERKRGKVRACIAQYF